MTNSKIYYTKTTLKKERGWTDKNISVFLGQHDLERPNPTYKNASPMLLYLIEKVVKVEDSAEFKTRSKTRQKGAQKAVETKTKKILDYINGLTITLEVLNHNEVIKKSCEHYNDRQMEINSYYFASPSSDILFLHRICVNYLRHCCSSYEYNLWRIFGKVGVGPAYVILKIKILTEIARVYPILKDECDRQAAPYKTEESDAAKESLAFSLR